LEAIRILGMEKEDAVLPGVHFGAVRSGAGGPAEGNHAVLSALALWRRQLYGYWITVNYREAYGMFASNGILFNHESPIRGETFVTRKITRSVARIETGLEDTLYLGNLGRSAMGSRQDYVEACTGYCRRTRRTISCWRRARPDRCANSSNLHSRRSTAASNGAARVSKKTGVDRKTGKTVVRIDPTYFRPTEVDMLIGDASKAREKLAGNRRRALRKLVKEMVAGDLRLPGGRLPMARTPFELNGKTVFVAGHGGMVGAALVRRLAQENAELLTVKAQ